MSRPSSPGASTPTAWSAISLSTGCASPSGGAPWCSRPALRTPCTSATGFAPPESSPSISTARRRPRIATASSPRSRLARPTKSLGLYRQMVGRVLRPYPNKADALILDHAGAVFAHGLPDDPIAWALHADRRAKNTAHAARGTPHAPALTTCPECAAVRFAGRPCPACGWRPVPKPQAIETLPGELARVDGRLRAAAGAASPAEREQFYRELVWIARERGRQPGWAAHVYREKFGAWPSAPPWAPPAPMPAGPAVRAYVRSRDIAYATSQARRRA